ncbi:MAG: hypothetical protein EOO42_23640 [Flavobacteriales bacterium]|nr:MAG: hypothetical protein EOO42_23640 [Flavobacteriales bacterium]
MLIRSKVLLGENLVGDIEKYDNGYGFTYDSKYLCSESTRPISLSFPYFKCICLYFFNKLMSCPELGLQF